MVEPEPPARATVAVPAGGVGIARQETPAPVTTARRSPPFELAERAKKPEALAGPTDLRCWLGPSVRVGERCQVPPGVIPAATRAVPDLWVIPRSAAGPRVVSSSVSTRTRPWRSGVGSAIGSRRQLPASSVKRPATPGRAQLAPTITPPASEVTAVRDRNPHTLPPCSDARRGAVVSVRQVERPTTFAQTCVLPPPATRATVCPCGSVDRAAGLATSPSDSTPLDHER